MVIFSVWVVLVGFAHWWGSKAYLAIGSKDTRVESKIFLSYRLLLVA